MAAGDKQELQRSRWHERMGAALVAPGFALSESDSPAGRGRSSGDIALLLVLTLAANQMNRLVSAGWMVYDGDWSGALGLVIGTAQSYLMMSVALLLAGTVLLSLVAGKSRSIADDFDLVCVALIPLVFLEVIHSLLIKAGLNVHPAGQILGYTWFAIMLLLGIRQARSREKVLS